MPENPEEQLARYAAELAAGIAAALPQWTVRCVIERLEQWSGPVDDEILAAARRAGEQAQTEVGTQIRDLLARDIDQQQTAPLSLVRTAVRYPTQVLRTAGVPPVVRDEFDERTFPDDIYGLSPASFADLDPSLHEPGLVWGAAKAHVHLARRRDEGQR